MHETTLDTILDGQVVLRQPREGYRVAIDPILLAATLPPDTSGCVVDLGAGSGAVSLSVAHRCAAARVIGLEIDPETAALAEANVRENDAGERVRIEAIDVREAPARLGSGIADLVLSNPPYLPAGRADISPDPGRARSDVEAAGELREWIAAAADLLRPKGRLTLVHRADRMDEIMAALSGPFGEVTLHPLWPKAGREAKRILVSARLGVRSPARLTAGTVLHDADGGYTETVRAILAGGHLPIT